MSVLKKETQRYFSVVKEISAMKVIIGSDHGGFVLKEFLKERLEKENIDVYDNGTHSSDMVDYPGIATETAQKLLADGYDCGILICGTGIGMSIAANKVNGIRAALCSDVYSAKMAKAHNDANIVSLGARTLGCELAWEIVQAYLGSSFLGGIHEKRVEMLKELDN
jgi:ribose 5-phosphate isomerase B